ncbi:MAG: hypothetical protein Fur005_27170 [Roseiflexaceae bacterium]
MPIYRVALPQIMYDRPAEEISLPIEPPYPTPTALPEKFPVPTATPPPQRFPAPTVIRPGRPTATATSIPATATATETSVPATATATETSVPATATSIPATATATPSPTVTRIPATATATSIPATATATRIPATATPTPIANLTGDVALWKPWEQRLAAPVGVEPAAISLSATLTAPDGSQIMVPGFWDGEAFVLRSFFGQAGRWTWSTSTSPSVAALNQQGQLQVGAVATNETNPLYRSGRLVVPAGGRYLAHADGTPFFWLGDTVWDAPLHMTDAEWVQYLDDRAARGFSVIQIALAPTWSGAQDRAGNPPFNGAIDQPNHPFWAGFERKVALANQRGLVVMVVGLGDPLAQNNTNQAAAERFSRYLIARLHAAHVIFSPSFDHAFNTTLDGVGNAMRSMTSQHLITQHPGTPSGQSTNVHAENYYSRSYLDISGNQSGHNSGNRSRVFGQAISWNLSLWKRGTKPVINLEAFYDANGTQPGANGSRQGTAYDARAAGYLSFFSGASGYTYGAQGLWQLQRDPSQADYWVGAMAYPSASEMTIMRNLLTSLPWWQLQPVHERILSQPALTERKIALAATADRRLALAYFPTNESATIDLSGFATTLQVIWINPTTGAQQGDANISGGGSVTLTPPASGDWVVLIQGL